jgi:hypothetical protein
MTHTSSLSATYSVIARSYFSRFISDFSFRSSPFRASYSLAITHPVAFPSITCTCHILFRGTCTFITFNGLKIAVLKLLFGIFGPLLSVMSSRQ